MVKITPSMRITTLSRNWKDESGSERMISRGNTEGLFFCIHKGWPPLQLVMQAP